MGMIADNFHRRSADEMVPVQIVLPAAPAVISSFIVNSENVDAVSAVTKIGKSLSSHGPGQAIMLTAAEFDAITDPNEFRAFP